MDTAPKTFRAALDLLKPTADGKIRGACHSGILRFFPAAKT
jgi:hypothetical protein